MALHGAQLVSGDTIVRQFVGVLKTVQLRAIMVPTHMRTAPATLLRPNPATMNYKVKAHCCKCFLALSLQPLAGGTIIANIKTERLSRQSGIDATNVFVTHAQEKLSALKRSVMEVSH